MKIRRSRKALSPVIATIILIAVTVAVSIAVAAWMGALTFSFMATEQGQVEQLQFVTTATPTYILVTFNNTGTTAITITQVWVNNVQIAPANVVPFAGTTPATQLGQSVVANSGVQWQVTTPITAGSTYAIMLVSSKGNKFTSTGSAPS
jgi:flagellin-like protein